MKFTCEQRRILRRLPCFFKVPFAMFFQIENAKPTVTVEVQPGEPFKPRVAQIASSFLRE